MLVGGFHVITSCFADVYLTSLILFMQKKRRYINQILFINVVSASVFLITTSYLLTVLWAIDKGMAFWGFLKFSPVLPFSYITMNLEPEDKRCVLKVIPLSGAFMTIVSYLLHLIPDFKKYFTVAGRLSGFFQYPNSFAAFLICGIVIIAYYYKKLFPKILLLSILIFGVFESGSRIAFAIMILGIFVLIISIKDKKISIAITLILLMGIGASLIYVHVTNNYYTVGRFLTSSVNESTLVGRILYYKDALPIILKHPFGLGYLGYSYIIGASQTGVYSVVFVHNELLQFLLDIGWIPVLVFLVALLKTLFSKRIDFCQKLVLSLLCTHALLDFDFQYISLLFVLLLTLDFRYGYEVELKSKLSKALCVASIVFVSCFYFGLVDLLTLVNANDIAIRLYPVHTNAEIRLLTESKSAEQQSSIAKDIIKRNEHISLAYAAMANYDFSLGNIEDFIANKKKSIELSPYDIEAYNDFAGKLIIAYSLYKQGGDSISADYCLKQVINLENELLEVKSRTSALAWKINDLPRLELSAEIKDFIKKTEE